jgi:hypothetical protein
MNPNTRKEESMPALKLGDKAPTFDLPYQPYQNGNRVKRSDFKCAELRM